MIQRLPDGGPIYYETDPGRLIVEPWNAVTSLTFLIPVIYLLWKLKGRYHDYKFLVYWLAPLMAVGGLGSSLYHAFRVHPVFLIIDIVPIALLTLSVSIYFWNKILPHWTYTVAVLVASFILRYILFGWVKGNAAINLSYFTTGLMIFLPAVIWLFRSRFYAFRYMLYSIIFLIIALFFRYADDWEHHYHPAGTHWLWHIFTTAGAMTLTRYLIETFHLKSESFAAETDTPQEVLVENIRRQ